MDEGLIVRSRNHPFSNTDTKSTRLGDRATSPEKSCIAQAKHTCLLRENNLSRMIVVQR